MDDDVAREAAACSTRSCGSAGWRSSSSGSRSSTPIWCAPGGWPQVGAIVAIMGVIDAVFAPRLLKKRVGRAGPPGSVKRFWKEVAVEPADGGWAILLDGRAGAARPRERRWRCRPRRLAEAIAEEWRSVEGDDRSAGDAADRARQCRDRPGRA